jgi:hypothetical protein
MKTSAQLAALKNVLTETQSAALKAVVTEWDKFDKNERARWGKSYTGFVDWTTEMGRVTTLHVLVSAKLVEARYTEMVTNPLLRGAYGRWSGGSRRETHIEIGVRPTDLGRSLTTT